MKSTEVYSLLKIEMASWFKKAGFNRTKGFLGWSRPHGDSHIVVWCQVSRSGWDLYAGSEFVVEFQRSTEPLIGGHPARRGRLASFLSSEEREEVRNIQNLVVSELHRPLQGHPSLHVSPSVTEWYLAKFKPVT